MHDEERERERLRERTYSQREGEGINGGGSGENINVVGARCRKVYYSSFLFYLKVFNSDPKTMVNLFSVVCVCVSFFPVLFTIKNIKYK